MYFISLTCTYSWLTFSMEMWLESHKGLVQTIQIFNLDDDAWFHEWEKSLLNFLSHQCKQRKVLSLAETSTISVVTCTRSFNKSGHTYIHILTFVGSKVGGIGTYGLYKFLAGFPSVLSHHGHLPCMYTQHHFHGNIVNNIIRWYKAQLLINWNHY